MVMFVELLILNKPLNLGERLLNLLAKCCLRILPFNTVHYAVVDKSKNSA